MSTRQQPWMYLCFLLTLLSMEAVNPFLPLIMKILVIADKHQIAKLSALAISAPMVGMIFLSPFWGRMADRYGAKMMVLRAGLTLSICQFCLGMVSSAYAFIAIRFMQGVFAGFITAMQTYAVDSCHQEKKTLMLSRLQSVKSIATAAGGMVGGSILAFLSYQNLFYLSSLCCFISTAIFAYALPDHTHVKIRERTPKKSVSLTSKVVVVLFLVFLSQLAKFLPQSFFALYAMALGGGSTFLVGFMYTAPAVSIILCSEFSSRIFSFFKNEYGLISSFIYIGTISVFGALVLLFQYEAHSFMCVLICRLLWGVVLSALLPALYTLLTDSVVNKGYMIGLANSVAKLGNLSGVMFGALLTGVMSIEIIFLIMALVYILISIISVVEINNTRIQAPHGEHVL